MTTTDTTPTTTFTFASSDELDEVFDCRYPRTGPFPNPKCAECPFNDGRCEAAFFLVMEGRPAQGDRIVVGENAYMTRTGADGRPVAVKEPA